MSKLDMATYFRPQALTEPKAAERSLNPQLKPSTWSCQQASVVPSGEWERKRDREVIRTAWEYIAGERTWKTSYRSTGNPD